MLSVQGWDSSAPPVLNVPTAALDAWQIQRGATEQGDRFGLTFAQAARGDLAVVLLALSCMAEEHMPNSWKRVLCGSGLTGLIAIDLSRANPRQLPSR